MDTEKRNLFQQRLRAFREDRDAQLAALKAKVFSLVAAHDFEAAESDLTEIIRVASNCRFKSSFEATVTTPLATVVGHIWDVIELASEDPSGEQLTAITVAFDNSRSAFDVPGHPVSPWLMYEGLGDSGFAFSEASDAELLEACAKYPAPWNGAERIGSRRMIDHTLDGIGELNRDVLIHTYAEFDGEEFGDDGNPTEAFKAFEREFSTETWSEDDVEVSPVGHAFPAAKLLLGVYYQRFMAMAAAEMEVPYPIVLIATSVDEPTIPTAHYRLPVKDGAIRPAAAQETGSGNSQVARAAVQNRSWLQRLLGS